MHRRTPAVVACLLVCLATACGGGGSSPAPTPPPSSPPASATAAPPPPPVTAPLTGLPLADPSLADRPAVSVKIDNTQAGSPQAGLNDADIVSEQPVEGGLTRLLATFQSRTASATPDADVPLVGPVRSARPVDAALLRLLHGGIFAFSGAAAAELAIVRRDSGAVLLDNDAMGRDAPFSRVTWRRAPYNLYSTGERLRAAATGDIAAPPEVFTFSAAPPATAAPAAGMTLTFSPAVTVGWTWDAASGLWLRTQYGAPHRVSDDRGRPAGQVDATNVVVLSVAVAPMAGAVDVNGASVQDVTMVGSGTVWLLRGGTVAQGTWQRPSLDDPLTLTASDGSALALKPGRTWIELLPRPAAPALR